VSRASREAKQARKQHERYLASLQPARPARPPRPGMWASMPTKVKVALVLGLALSFPVAQGWNAGTIGTTSAAIRVAVALGIAYLGVHLVTTVVGGYLPKPELEPEDEPVVDDDVEDALVVEAEEAPAEG
jgi:hypothetical protein